MTTDDRLRLALEAAERGDNERCRELLAQVERQIDHVLTVLAKAVADKATSPLQ
jgi:phage gp29-like protein